MRQTRSWERSGLLTSPDCTPASNTLLFPLPQKLLPVLQHPVQTPPPPGSLPKLPPAASLALPALAGTGVKPCIRVPDWAP